MNNVSTDCKLGNKLGLPLKGHIYYINEHEPLSWFQIEWSRPENYVSLHPMALLNLLLVSWTFLSQKAPEKMFLVCLLLWWSGSPWTLIKSDAKMTLALSRGLKETLPQRRSLFLVYTPFYQTSLYPLVQTQANQGPVNDIKASLVLICSERHNQVTRTGWLNRKGLSGSLGARNPRPKCQQGGRLVRVLSLGCRWLCSCCALMWPFLCACMWGKKGALSHLFL